MTGCFSRYTLFGLLWLGVPLLSVAQDNSLGRLFFTENERESLDALRERGGREDIIEPPTVIEDEPPVVPDDVKVNGLVLRQDAEHHTVWVNGKVIRLWEKARLDAQGLSVDVARIDGINVPVKVVGTSDPAWMRPGYSHNTDTGETSEGYQSARLDTRQQRVPCSMLREERWETRDKHWVCTK